VGYALHREVRDFLVGTEASSLERIIAIEIAIEADDKTRNCRRWDKQTRRWIPTVTVGHLIGWTGGNERTVSEMLRRLARRGLDLRKPLGKDKDGKTMYARKGHATEFCVPPLPTITEPKPQPCLSSRDRCNT